MTLSLQLTCVILGVLRFNANGSPHLVFQKDGSLTWPNGAALTNVRLSAPSSIRGYANQSLTFSGQLEDEVSSAVCFLYMMLTTFTYIHIY